MRNIKFIELNDCKCNYEMNTRKCDNCDALQLKAKFEVGQPIRSCLI